MANETNVLLHMVTVGETPERHGDVYIFTTRRQHVTIRVTPTGLIRIGEIRNRRFPYDRDRDEEKP
jgi:hypothetical protein